MLVNLVGPPARRRRVQIISKGQARVIEGQGREAGRGDPADDAAHHRDVFKTILREKLRGRGFSWAQRGLFV